MVDISKTELLREYERALRAVDDPDTYDTEALLALTARDVIEDHWADLSSDDRELVARLDDKLAAKHQVVAEVLPEDNIRDRRRWWWFLNEGPQVRKESQAA